MGNDHATFGVGPIQDVGIGGPDQLELGDGRDVLVQGPERRNNLRGNVFVRQEREVLGPHAAETFRSQTTSFWIEWAAYSSAAASPSGSTCG